MGFESFWNSGMGVRCPSRPAENSGRVFLDLVWPPLSVLEVSPSMPWWRFTEQHLLVVSDLFRVYICLEFLKQMYCRKTGFFINIWIVLELGVSNFIPVWISKTWEWSRRRWAAFLCDGSELCLLSWCVVATAVTILGEAAAFSWRAADHTWG